MFSEQGLSFLSVGLILFDMKLIEERNHVGGVIAKSLQLSF